MANICDETVTLVTKTDADMAFVMETMLRNVISGPYTTTYVTEDEIVAASGDINKLYNLMSRCVSMNKLRFFAPEVDTRAEYGFIYWPEHHNNMTIFSVEMGLKWAPSTQPNEFCQQLDHKKYGWCIVTSGEWSEWESIEVCSSWKDTFIGGSEAYATIRNSVRAKYKSKRIHSMAYHTGISLVSPEGYLYMNSDDDE